MQRVNDSTKRRSAATAEAGGDSTVAGGIASRPSLLLAHIGTALEAAADDWLAPSGLNGRDYAVLAILTSDAPHTQQELARLLGKVPGIAVIAVDRLEAAGFVERQRDPGDRRRSRVVATEAGRKALRKADRLSDDGLSQLLPGLDADQRSSLHKLLTLGVARSIEDDSTAAAPSA
jgi:DNA-binding MarR family transcriptional regulator